MDFKPGFRHVQIVARLQRVQFGIVVNAFDGVIARCAKIDIDAVIFAHEPLQKCRVQQLVAHHVKIVRT